jgi:uncharacterized damage-inducible protein DinB
MQASDIQTGVVSAQALLAHWQGHRRLTRRVIEAFPEDKLFSFSVGGMRPFSAFVMEFVGMAVPVVHGVATGEWKSYEAAEKPQTKADLLALWDRQTKQLDEEWAKIPPHRFAEEDVAFGQWKSSGLNTILYAIDNEVHHRGQGYVYLRALGIEPPPFWERN